MASTDWLDELGADAPPNYRAAVQIEAVGTARRSHIEARIAELEASITATLNGTDNVPKSLTRIGTELVSLRAVLALAPPVQVVPDAIHADAARTLPMRRPAMLPPPPALAGELVHHRVHHPHDSAPDVPGSDESLVLAAYIATSARASALVVRTQEWRAALGTRPIADEKATWRELLADWAAVRAAINELGPAIERADTARRASGAEHRCFQWEGARLAPLPPVSIEARPWTIEHASAPQIIRTPEDHEIHLARTARRVSVGSGQRPS
jgi:hypothetical protein